ncbi:MAG: hypothetical protein ACREAB_20975 [Blastocatellia bacterium]
MLKKHTILFVFTTIACLTGCAGQSSQNPSASSSQAVEKSSPDPAAQKAAASTPEQTPEGRWVTTEIQTGVFGPDGKQRRWVKLLPGRPVKLAKGEWVTSDGTKYTGRAGGVSAIVLDSGKIKGHHVDASNVEK